MDYFKPFKKKIDLTIFSDTAYLESAWKSPSNIALVKYWGKKTGQLPANPSLSMTLDKAATYTWVKAYPPGHAERSRSMTGEKDLSAGHAERSRSMTGEKDLSAGHAERSRSMTGKGIISINNDPSHPFIPKLSRLIEILAKEIPVLKELNLEIRTENSFPHSTGIASSASGISAFVFCLFGILAEMTGADSSSEAFFRAVSFASRLGSGSACRSVYGGFTVWGKTPLLKGSSDLEAVPVNEWIHPDFQQLQDTILVVSSEPKSLASSLGHSLMDQHPFAKGRYSQAHQNLDLLTKALYEGDFEQLALISENETLSLHALMMTSGENGFLMKPGTVEIIQKIRKARKEGLPVFFTLDAGPNIHMLFVKSFRKKIEQFTRNELLLYCENQKVIFDSCGEGPVQIQTSLF
ncbi:MAG: diphosphomevalonate/mevalonate 3,5-bisphosphate decarboxylase family protein [Bacteroidales bacterium]